MLFTIDENCQADECKPRTENRMKIFSSRLLGFRRRVQAV